MDSCSDVAVLGALACVIVGTACAVALQMTRRSKISHPLLQKMIAIPSHNGPHLGDVMGIARAVPGDLDLYLQPTERIILTANGNLQCIMSSYYNRPVEVRLRFNHCIQPGHYERQVTLHCCGKQFCTATSIVLLTDEAMLQAVEQGKMGIGQLFRQFDLLPRFELLEAGKHVKGTPIHAEDHPLQKGYLPWIDVDTDLCAGLTTEAGWWRLYLLKAKGIVCRIFEAFPEDVLSIPVEPSPSTNKTYACASSHLGDIMGMQTDCCIPGSDFSPLERILLTANGNVQRIMSSYYHTSVRVRVRFQRRVQQGLYHRVVDMSCFGMNFLLATTAVSISNRDILSAVESGKVDVGAVFLAYSILPRFRLLNAGRNDDKGLWRTYELSSSGIVCEVREDFRPELFHLEAPSDLLGSFNLNSSSPSVLPDLFHISKIKDVPSPALLRSKYPLSSQSERDHLAIRSILSHDDHRLLVLIGPCTPHSMADTLEYAKWLLAQSKAFADDLLIVMATNSESWNYRSSLKGMIKDPDLTGSGNIFKSLWTANNFLSDLIAPVVPCGCDIFEPSQIQKYADLLSSPNHDVTVSISSIHTQIMSALALSIPVGLLSGPNANKATVANPLKARQLKCFLGPNYEGVLSSISGGGHADTHLTPQCPEILDPTAIADVSAVMHTVQQKANVQIDLRQRINEALKQDVDRVADLIATGDCIISGVMIQPNLIEGCRELQFGRVPSYEQSIIEPCVGLPFSETILSRLAMAARKRRSMQARDK